jgi:hypothetical protein
MRLKTLLEEWVRNMASFDPSWMLQTQVDPAENLPCQGMPSGRNSGAPVRRGCPPDLDAQMEAIVEAVSREEQRWPSRSDPSYPTGEERVKC